MPATASSAHACPDPVLPQTGDPLSGAGSGADIERLIEYLKGALRCGSNEGLCGACRDGVSDVIAALEATR